MPRTCATPGANVRVFCFDEGSMREVACDSACDPFFVAQEEFETQAVEMRQYEISSDPSSLSAVVLCCKNAAHSCERNETVSGLLGSNVYGPAVIALLEEGTDEAHGDLDSEFSVLVSLEEFMCEVHRRRSERPCDVEASIYDLFQEMRKAPLTLSMDESDNMQVEEAESQPQTPPGRGDRDDDGRYY